MNEIIYLTDMLNCFLIEQLLLNLFTINITHGLYFEYRCSRFSFYNSNFLILSVNIITHIVPLSLLFRYLLSFYRAHLFSNFFSLLIKLIRKKSNSFCQFKIYNNFSEILRRQIWFKFPSNIFKSEFKRFFLFSSFRNISSAS